MTKIAFAKYDPRTGQYAPAIETFGYGIPKSIETFSPTSFEESRALEIAREILKADKSGALRKASKWRFMDKSDTFCVVSAAMLMDDGLIVTGVRHFSPDMRAVLNRIYGEGYHLRVKEQGFIDSHGNFLTREIAWIRADKNGQICLYDPSGKGRLIPQKANLGTIELLFSENLY